ncbi:glycosyltransferase family 2 protein [Flavobacterium pallidum]|uniref:Glycosyltransferase family 2 protein n=1 Tax=Flavobacterium pallidum TaxID=2172098 RepID=A0A2S1SH51_9FLAO|nr:glycosyltransferase family A protein [Flavobacterium pallidum]AWI25677.1 glycosyltransferase family 2 protein [Flavobacterium pallidum]
MIVIYHSNDRAEACFANGAKIDIGVDQPVVKCIFDLAKQYPDEILAWCNSGLKDHFNTQDIESFLSAKNKLISCNPGTDFYLGNRIGYVEESPFINVKKDVVYPTWLMSGDAGAAHAGVFNSVRKYSSLQEGLDYFLNSTAKRFMPSGLLCYAEPGLLKYKNTTGSVASGNSELFRFVSQHYKKQWVILLFLNIWIYERKLPVLAFLKSLLYRKKRVTDIHFDNSKTSSKIAPESACIDVIIPTIGRKDHVYDILKDLSIQSKMPAKVIVIEQNPDVESHSELDFIANEAWPFPIKHIFTHQSGACNARNIALEHVDADLVFFADDDIRIESDFMSDVLKKMLHSEAQAVSVNCLLKGQVSTYRHIFQWHSFGSGCSFVFSRFLKGLQFNPGYEFGFGEDADFGMQLRNSGCDILFFPTPDILHLKAPAGGFRIKKRLAWHADEIQPKPSPTIMLHMLLHYTPQQQRSYKTTLFFKYYRIQRIKNPWAYYRRFQKQWDSSVFWAEELKKNPELNRLNN